MLSTVLGAAKNKKITLRTQGVLDLRKMDGLTMLTAPVKGGHRVV